MSKSWAHSFKQFTHMWWIWISEWPVGFGKNWRQKRQHFAVGHGRTNRSLFYSWKQPKRIEETFVHPLSWMWVTFSIIEWSWLPCPCTASRITLEVVWIAFQQHRLVGNLFPQSKTITNLRGVLMLWFLKQMYAHRYPQLDSPFPWRKSWVLTNLPKWLWSV